MIFFFQNPNSIRIEMANQRMFSVGQKLEERPSINMLQSTSDARDQFLIKSAYD